MDIEPMNFSGLWLQVCEKSSEDPCVMELFSLHSLEYRICESFLWFPFVQELRKAFLNFPPCHPPLMLLLTAIFQFPSIQDPAGQRAPASPWTGQKLHMKKKLSRFAQETPGAPPGNPALPLSFIPALPSQVKASCRAPLPEAEHPSQPSSRALSSSKSAFASSQRPKEPFVGGLHLKITMERVLDGGDAQGSSFSAQDPPWG